MTPRQITAKILTILYISIDSLSPSDSPEWNNGRCELSLILEKQVKITLVISGMGCGGAEKVMAALSAHLVESGRDAQLLSVRPDQAFYPINEKVDFRISDIPTPDDISFIGRLLNFYKKVLWLRNEFKKRKPDVIVSFTEAANCMALAAARGLHIPVIVSERVNPIFHPVPSIYQFLRKMLYPGADAVVLQTEDLRLWASGWLREEQIKVIPNPVTKPPDEGANPLDFLKDDRKTIVAMGRFAHQKGFDMLLEAFSKVDRTGWKLLLIGDGALRKDLEDLRKTLLLDDDVLMPGIIREPAPVLRKCDLFVMSSRYEGFPNALCEALACGLPVISFNCPSGPGDIIRNEIDGALVPDGDVGALAETMKRLMKDDAKRKSMSEKAVEISNRFSPERIMKMWDDVINESARDGGKGY